MIVALALFGYAGLLLTAGAAALARARWPDSAPRLAMAAWFALTGSAVASVLAGGLALMVPTVRVSADLAGLLSARPRGGGAGRCRAAGRRPATRLRMMSGDEPVRHPATANPAVRPPRLRARMPVRFALPPRGWAAAVRRALGQHKIAAGASSAGLALAVAAAVTGTPGHPHGAAARVPGFTLPALGHPGEHVSLAAYAAGRGQLLRLLVRALQEGDPAAGQVLPHPRERIVMIGVDVNDAAAAALRFVRTAGVTYPVGVDRTAAAAAAWGVVALPQTFFLDAGRHVIERVFGAVTPAELTRDTAQLAGTPGPLASGSHPLSPAGPAG